jgi:hypothetical protein
MTLSSLLRITPRLTPTAARRTSRAVSSATNASNATKSLDSILIANRGEIALYVACMRKVSRIRRANIGLLDELDALLRSVESA